VGRLLDEFTAKGVDAVILDLRQNPGGSLQEAIDTTGLFIDVDRSSRSRANPATQPYEDLVPGMAWKGPLVILTSKFSASASEILAGAIQDYRRGLVIGDQSTHGKGTVQSLIQLGPKLFHHSEPARLGSLKLTMQQFYVPTARAPRSAASSPT